MANKQDTLMFKALKKAYFAGKIEVVMDMGILNRYGSPVYNPWQNIIPIMALCLLGLLVIFTLNMFFGLITIIMGFFVHQIYITMVVEKLVKDKVLEIMFKSLGNFQYMWSMNALTILMKNNNMVGCRAKDGDIKAFVALNLAEFMMDKRTDDNLKMPPPPPDLEQMIVEAKQRQEELLRRKEKPTSSDEIPQIEDDFDEDDLDTYEENDDEDERTNNRRR